jgi:hypothetical protein
MDRRQSMSDPYRHPAGRTCSGVMATWAAIAGLLAMIARKAAR